MREISAQTMARPRKINESTPNFEQPQCQKARSGGFQAADLLNGGLETAAP